MPKSMLLSAAERARKDVGEWWSLHAQNKCGIGGGYEDLIARLTPVYERAQKHDDATAYCSGEFPCEASTAAASLERERNDAEAIVAQIRQALSTVTCPLCGTKPNTVHNDIADFGVHCPLAETEPTP